MIGKIIGAAAGATAGKAVSGITGVKGALIGTVAVAAARRMGVVGLVAAGVGGYMLKKANDKRNGKRATLTPAAPAKKPTRTAPKAT